MVFSTSAKFHVKKFHRVQDSIGTILHLFSSNFCEKRKQRKLHVVSSPCNHHQPSLPPMQLQVAPSEVRKTSHSGSFCTHATKKRLFFSVDLTWLGCFYCANLAEEDHLLLLWYVWFGYVRLGSADQSIDGMRCTWVIREWLNTLLIFLHCCFIGFLWIFSLQVHNFIERVFSWMLLILFFYFLFPETFTL